jgi:ATPase, P-type (transporting), HAD superfamily, subfamily IC
MASKGLRILGVAKSSFSLSELPRIQHDFVFTFLGLIGFADPVRPGIAEAVSECYAAGIRIIMITGDYPRTASNIADQIGILHTDNTVTGTDLTKCSDDDLKERLKTATVFARAVPEQKLRIVRALKANNEVVAMTGDGVNDAPALKSADIGIAMGGRGTDVAREASSLVLLDDNFTSIVSAVRLGRRIYDNLKKAMAYIFSIHIPIAGMSLIPVIFDMPLILMPMHIVFLELIIDPTCSIVFEAEKEEQDIMNRPPRSADERLFTPKTLFLSLMQGFVVLGVVMLVYLYSLMSGFFRNRGAYHDFYHHCARKPASHPDQPILVRDDNLYDSDTEYGYEMGICWNNLQPCPDPCNTGTSGSLQVFSDTGRRTCHLCPRCQCKCALV